MRCLLVAGKWRWIVGAVLLSVVFLAVLYCAWRGGVETGYRELSDRMLIALTEEVSEGRVNPVIVADDLYSKLSEDPGWGRDYGLMLEVMAGASAGWGRFDLAERFLLLPGHPSASSLNSALFKAEVALMTGSVPLLKSACDESPDYDLGILMPLIKGDFQEATASLKQSFESLEWPTHDPYEIVRYLRVCRWYIHALVKDPSGPDPADRDCEAERIFLSVISDDAEWSAVLYLIEKNPEPYGYGEILMRICGDLYIYCQNSDLPEGVANKWQRRGLELLGAYIRRRPHDDSWLVCYAPIFHEEIAKARTQPNGVR
jgi:hypothetical protein